MKKFTKTIFIVMALSVMMSLLTACPNDAKSSSQKDDRTDLTTRQTETGLNPDISEPNQTINTMDTEKEKETTEPETSSSEVTTTSQTTAKPTAKPKAKALGKTTVTDAYKRTYKSKFQEKKITSRVPKVTIKGVDTKAVNKEMSDFAKTKAKKDWQCWYKYYIGKTYVSIIVSCYPDDGSGDDNTDVRVYNVSRKTGKKLTRKQMLKELGISNKKFNARVKKSMKKGWKKDYLKGATALTKKMYKKAISKKTLNKAIPCVNSKGKVCFLVKNMEFPFSSNSIDYLRTC